MGVCTASAWRGRGGGGASGTAATTALALPPSLPSDSVVRLPPPAAPAPASPPKPPPCSGTTGRPKGVLLSHRAVVLHALATILGGSRALLRRAHTPAASGGRGRPRLCGSNVCPLWPRPPHPRSTP
jgi:non-ribosomal peptide synthetase component F